MELYKLFTNICRKSLDNLTGMEYNMYVDYCIFSEVIFMRKLLAIALACILMVATLASCAAGLGDPDAINNYTPEVKTITTDKGVFTFEEADGETAILVGYNGKATKDDHVVIPSTFNDRTVTVIGEKAFYSLAAIVEVTIPDTIVEIDKYAFARCTELTAINLPAGLLEIDDYAFAECDKLASVNLGSSITTIGEKAFWGCTALTNITLPATLAEIQDAAFWGCTALTAVEFPASVKTIGTLAYYNCTGIESIKFNKDDITIGEYAFVTEGSTLKDKIDVSNLAEGSKVLEYVNNIAEPAEETEAPETEAPEA